MDLLTEGTAISEHGDALFARGCYEEAKAEYECALRIFSQLRQTDERGGAIGMTMELNNIGMCLIKLHRQDEALQAFLDAMDHCRPHWRDTPDALASLLASPTLSAAAHLADRGDLHRASELAIEAVHLCRASTEPGPLQLDDRLARALRLCALIWGAQNRGLDRALLAATEALTIFKHLAQADRRFSSELPLAYSTFAGVLDRLGRHADAATVREKTGIAGPPWRNKIDPGKLAQDYPAKPFENTLRGLQDLETRIALNPQTLAEAVEATQQWNEILKEVTASLATSTISQRQYDEIFCQIYPRLRDDAGELEQMRGAAAKGQDVDLARLTQVLDSYLDSLRRFAEGGNSKLVEATKLNALGTEFLNQGDYARAEPLLRNALAIREKALGQEDLNVATSINNLAVLLKRKGDYTEASQLNRRALAIREKLLGSDHPDVALSLNNLGELLRQIGDFDGAQALFQRALAIWEKTRGHDPGLGLTLNNLALVLRQKGNLDAAESLHRRALSVRERTLGADHPDVAQSLNNLGMLLNYRENYAAAEPLLRRALAIREKAFGPEHPDVANSLNNLALLLQNRSNFKDAEPLCRRSLAIQEKVLGSNHPEVAASLNNLALLLSYRGDHADAEQLLQRALTIEESALGLDHPATKMARENLAAMRQSLGRPIESGSAVDGLQKLNGDVGTKTTHTPRFDFTVRSVWDLNVSLALQMAERGDTHNAEATLRGCVQQGDRRSAATAALNLGLLLLNRGDLDGADAAFVHGLTSDDPEVIVRSALNLGKMRHKRNNPKGALAAFQSAVDAGPSSLLPLAQLLLGAALETNRELHQARGVYELAAASSDGAVADRAKKALQSVDRKIVNLKP